METLYILVLLAAAGFVLWFEFAGQRIGIGAIPTLPHQRATLIRALQRHRPAREDLTVLELGCGWGGLVGRLARALPRARIIGYELFPPAWIVSRVRFAVHPRVTIRRADFFAEPLPPADMIVCYLSFGLMARLGPKLKSDLPPGTLVISGSFPIPDWTPIEIAPIPGPIKAPVYVYRT